MTQVTLTKKTISVVGRNGYEYDATHVVRNLYVVGKFVVVVVKGKCETTICKATKANIARLVAE